MLRAAESAAVSSRNDQKPLVLTGTFGLKPETIISPLNEENPCKTRVFDSSEGGTRTRDPRLMKPVPTVESIDVTSNSNNDLRDEQRQVVSDAQQKAQQSEPDDSNDPCLAGMLRIWSLLSASERSSVLEHAAGLIAVNNSIERREREEDAEKESSK